MHYYIALKGINKNKFDGDMELSQIISLIALISFGNLKLSYLIV